MQDVMKRLFSLFLAVYLSALPFVYTLVAPAPVQAQATTCQISTDKQVYQPGEQVNLSISNAIVDGNYVDNEGQILQLYLSGNDGDRFIYLTSSRLLIAEGAASKQVDFVNGSATSPIEITNYVKSVTGGLETANVRVTLVLYNNNIFVGNTDVCSHTFQFETNQDQDFTCGQPAFQVRRNAANPNQVGIIASVSKANLAPEVRSQDELYVYFKKSREAVSKVFIMPLADQGDLFTGGGTWELPNDEYTAVIANAYRGIGGITSLADIRGMTIPNHSNCDGRFDITDTTEAVPPDQLNILFTRPGDSPFRPEAQSTPFQFCSQAGEGSESYEKCCQCLTGSSSCSANAGGIEPRIWTSVGCLDTDAGPLVSSLITLGLRIGGGAALLVIITGGFILTTSQGDPKKTGEAKEMITSAVVGLLFIIFSVTILQFVGVNILRIPGFGNV